MCAVCVCTFRLPNATRKEMHIANTQIEKHIYVISTQQAPGQQKQKTAESNNNKNEKKTLLHIRSQSKISTT